jgi:DNA helicase-2/ATP-dependent DNA helicase PcrA
MSSPVFQKAFEQLNPDQKRAVTTFDGPVLVVAGPGTGKTQILTMRIAYILQQEDIKPGNILALTFTESGVNAMKERLIKLIGPTGYYVHIKTFHSFCNDVILEFPDKFSYKTKDFTNLTDIERFKIIRELIDTLPLEHLRSFRETYFYVREILQAIQELKKEGKTPLDFKQITQEYEQLVLSDPSYLNKNGTVGERYRKEMKKVQKNKELALLYEAYQNKLTELGRYDYEDMIMFVVEKLKTDEELLRDLQERYLHFLVDEYQDTNGAQNEVIYRLAQYFENPNLFVVGDDDQSIYRFQGASLENMLYMNDKFNNVTTIVLHTNYRSPQAIIDASTSVIQHNKDRITNPKYGFQIDKTFTSASSGMPGTIRHPHGVFHQVQNNNVSLCAFSNGDIENFYLASSIAKLIQEGVPPKEIAIIYRNNKDATDIINVLSRKGIPWVMEGGFDILQDNEISKIIEILHVINDPTQSDIIFRVLHHEAFEIPPIDLMKLSRLLYNHKKGEHTMIDIALDKQKLQENGLLQTEKIVEVATKILLHHKESKTSVLLDLVETSLRDLGILDHFLNKNDLVSINRLNTLFHFLKAENYKNHKWRLQEFLSDISLMEEEGISLPENNMEALNDGVHLMTAHKAKGLEFDYVFITKCIDGKWGNPKKPSVLSLPPNILHQQDTRAIPMNEDERRLFYVALTRAKKKATILYSHQYSFDNKASAIPSQFIAEIDESHITKEDVAPYEHQAREVLQLLFTPDHQDINGESKKFLQQLVKGYRINPVAFNTYLSCPRLFMYDHLVRVPATKSKLQKFGTIIHRALEDFFRAFQKTGKAPLKTDLLEVFQNALDEELLDEEEKKVFLQEGKRILSSYYDFYEGKFIQPLYLERDYNRILLYFDDIPLSGKVDKIEMTLKVKDPRSLRSRQVRVVDYKTGRPKTENDIKGLTDSSRGEKDYFYQLLFYKLLIELDKDLDAEAVSGMLDFVFPEKDGKEFKQVEIEYKEEDYETFKTILKDVYNKIQSLEFPKTTDLRNCEDCPYRKICWKDTLF